MGRSQVVGEPEPQERKEETMSSDIQWRKSTFTDGVQCVEVALIEGRVLLRDDKTPDQIVTMTTADFAAFAAGVKAGEFDDFC
jgi:hypothetical protein